MRIIVYKIMVVKEHLECKNIVKFCINNVKILNEERVIKLLGAPKYNKDTLTSKHRQGADRYHVRRAVTEKFNNYITMNYSKYVHATREMAAHLTRQT